MACFAYEHDAHFIDTNVRRVLHRLFLGAEVPEPRAKEGELLGLAEAIVPRDRAWGWGQSVMELGALRCKARKPLRAACPVGELCAARPTIAEALARRPRGAKAAQGRGGPNRHHRGRVLAVLREGPPEGVALGELGKALREGFGEADLPWLRSVVDSLRKDGLARVSSEEAWSADPPRQLIAAGGRRRTATPDFREPPKRAVRGTGSLTVSGTLDTNAPTPTLTVLR